MRTKNRSSERTAVGELPFLEGFPPILGDSPRVLILGSMPSERSLREGQYYGHPRNRFWPLMVFLLAGSEETIPYEERTGLLKRKGIALWDSIGRCRREGSLDSNIEEAVPNPIDGLIDSVGTIRFILFNGAAAEKMFRRTFSVKGDEWRGIRLLALPSTSPANAAWSVSRLREAWGRALMASGI